MSVVLRPVETPADQEQLAELAGRIWREYWPAHIGAAQTEYMIRSFQSLGAIRRDMAENAYEYWFVCEKIAVAEPAGAEPGAAPSSGERVVGYTGGHVEAETGRFFISKIYLLAEERGKHFASAVIAFYEQLCRDRGLKAMYLTVNKHNELGIRTYRGKGFETVDAVETDIGKGFVMDDYIMEKRV